MSLAVKTSPKALGKAMSDLDKDAVIAGLATTVSVLQGLIAQASVEHEATQRQLAEKVAYIGRLERLVAEKGAAFADAAARERAEIERGAGVRKELEHLQSVMRNLGLDPVLIAREGIWSEVAATLLKVAYDASREPPGTTDAVRATAHRIARDQRTVALAVCLSR
jgi:argininosuccinate lyase